MSHMRKEEDDIGVHERVAATEFLHLFIFTFFMRVFYYIYISMSIFDIKRVLEQWLRLRSPNFHDSGSIFARPLVFSCFIYFSFPFSIFILYIFLIVFS